MTFNAKIGRGVVDLSGKKQRKKLTKCLMFQQILAPVKALI